MQIQNYNIGTVHCSVLILILIFKYFSIDSIQFFENAITEKIIFYQVFTNSSNVHKS